jgi:hypothetical protein
MFALEREIRKLRRFFLLHNTPHFLVVFQLVRGLGEQNGHQSHNTEHDFTNKDTEQRCARFLIDNGRVQQVSR